MRLDKIFIRLAVAARDEFREEQHPRAENGQFTSAGGGSTKTESIEPEDRTIQIGNHSYKASDKVLKFSDARKRAQLWAIETKKGVLETARPFYKQYQEGTANEDNYYCNTIAEFTPVVRRPRRKPDFVSYTRDGKVSSEYWYTPEGVIRGSGHWGTGVGSCDWYLGDQGTDMRGGKQYGFARWGDFVQKTSIITGNGRAVLSTFANTIGAKKSQYGDSTPIIKGVNDE